MGSRWNPLQVALVGLIVALATLRGITTGDEAIHYAHARSLVRGEGGALDLDPGPLPVPSRPRSGGLFYQSADGLRSAHAPGLAWLGLPLVWVGERIFGGAAPPLDALFAGGTPDAVLGPIRGDPRLALFSLIGPLSFALALFAILATAREIGLGQPARWAIFFALLASPLGVYGGAAFAQGPLAACVALAIWAWVRVDSKPSRWGHLVLGLAVAAGLLLRPESGPLWLAALLGAALAKRQAIRPDPEFRAKPRRRQECCGGPSTPRLSIQPDSARMPPTRGRRQPRGWRRRLSNFVPLRLCATNFSFRFLYPDKATSRAAGAGVHRWWLLLGLPPFAATLALLGVGVPTTMDGFSWTHLIEGIPGLLLSPAAGLFVHAPFVIIALAWGMRYAPRPLYAGIAAGLIAAIALYGAWFDWPSDLCFGPRLLAPAMPGLALLFGVAWQRGGRGLKVAGCLAIASSLTFSLPARLIAWPRVESRSPWDWRTLIDGFGPLAEVGVSDLLLFAGPVVPIGIGLATGVGLYASRRGRELPKT